MFIEEHKKVRFNKVRFNIEEQESSRFKKVQESEVQEKFKVQESSRK